MTNYIIGRIVQAVPVMLLTSFVVFLMLHLAPGNPVDIIIGTKTVDYTEEDVRRIERELGLDKPLLLQYVYWLGDTVQGDLGSSFYLRREIRPLVIERMGSTAVLALGALAFAVPIGIGGGVLSSLMRGTVWDRLINAVIVGGVAVPTFAAGLLLIVIFSVKLEWLPVGGMTSFDGGSLIDRLRHLVLPAISLGVGPAAILARLTRSAMLEVLNEDYVRTARAKGLREALVVRRHAFRNVLIPVITVIGLQVGYLLGGAVLIEVVFSWPGMGSLVINGILQRDFPIVQAGVLVIAIIFIVVNLLVDVLYAMVDPRIRYSS
jgi:ABC-type dipeptide/oligopeptide/nickel transport system permease component